MDIAEKSVNVETTIFFKKKRGENPPFLETGYEEISDSLKLDTNSYPTLVLDAHFGQT